LELLSKCQGLYKELYDNIQAMNKIQEQFKDEEIPLDKFETLSLKEFEIAIKISGAYGDLMYSLTKLERETDNMQFYVKRVRSNAQKLVGDNESNNV
jgi:hypothetical protein